jgi:hypothetical protein
VSAVSRDRQYRNVSADRPPALEARQSQANAVLAAFGLTTPALARTPAEVARLVSSAAAASGETFARRLCRGYVIAEPCFRFGLIPRSLPSVVRPGDWERLVLERYDELDRWRERDFVHWLNGLIRERVGVHRRARPRRGPSAGDDATAAALVASISADV